MKTFTLPAALLALAVSGFGVVAQVAPGHATECRSLYDTITQGQRSSVLASMEQDGEALPRNVNPYMNWRKRGRIGAGNSPGDYAAFVPWGQIYAADGQSAYAPATVAIRNVNGYILSKKTQRWKLISSTNVIEGANFLPNYDKNSSKPAVIKPGKSYTSVVLDPNYSFHFWPKSGRVKIDGADIGGTMVSFDVKITSRSSPPTQYVFSAGGDYWKATDSKWSNYKTNGDAGIGRFIYAKENWRTAFMTTGSVDDLRKCLD